MKKTAAATARPSKPSKDKHMNFVEFENDGRTFTCQAESSPATPDTLWWWIRVTGESQRYAAFRREPGDTAPNLRPRVLAYYAQLLVDRARPREIRTGWAQRRNVAKKPDAEGGPAAV
jgi:hypothetical protein